MGCIVVAVGGVGLFQFAKDGLSAMGHQKRPRQPWDL